MDPKRIIHKSVTVYGTVTSQRSGWMEFDGDFEVAGRKQFRSADFQKYPDGTRLECHFKIVGSRRTLMYAKPIAEERFNISISETTPGHLINSIREMRAIFNLGLSEAKDLVESINSGTPYTFKNDVNQATVIAVKKDFEVRAPNLKLEITKIASVEPPSAMEPESVQPTEVFPQYIDDHFVPDEFRELFTVVKSIMIEGGHFNLLTRGLSGYGKTSVFQAIASHLGMRCVIVNCAAIMDTEQWFGYQEARGGETVFIPTEFSEAAMAGNALIILDEANRIEPWLANSLFPMLDHRRSTNIHGFQIDVGPSVIFAHTINEGVKFAGTHVMDAAYLNRMDAVLEVGPLPRKVETRLIVGRCGVDQRIAEKIVNVCAALRTQIEKDALDIDASTRTSLKVARLARYGMSIKSAFERVVVSIAQQEDRKAVLDIINTHG